MPWGLRSRRGIAYALLAAILPANIGPRMSRHPLEADMTTRIPENVSSWLVDWSFVTINWATPIPPRDPNDDDDDAEDEDDEPDDDLEPPVVREPDE
jgi:hypothetical protein